MRDNFLRAIVLVLPVAMGLSATAGKGAAAPTPVQARFFENKVRPLLAKSCYRCHSAEKRGGLRLDSRSAILSGGESGPAIVPGRPRDSLLIKAVNYHDLEMPPGKPLARTEIAVLTEWVQIGAPWPGTSSETSKPIAAHKKDFAVTPADRNAWAFRPVVRPPVPVVGGASNPLDAFLLQRLRAKGLTMAPGADRRTLIRRASFDLIGLPPTPEDVDRFVADDRPDAYERLLDRLLASPQYGERWGRHWLDVVRFGQSNGYERDSEKPFAWRYRDYVIKALNEDKPYDQFVREQLAGDELEQVTDDSVTATAFYRLGVWDDEPDDRRLAEYEDLDDMVSTAGSAFLGLTVGCARCHDHKFDPIGQDDYYATLAFLRNIKPYSKPGLTGIHAVLTTLKAGGRTLAVQEVGPRPVPTHVLLRGSPATPGKEVQPRFLRVLCKTDDEAVPRLPAPSPGARSTGRRRALAEWVASPGNPLTARVIVNRLWHHHFGRGIVSTPSDFGRTGVAPTHPELLDWLASELVAGGWRLKRMHKIMMLSHAYRQSSQVKNEPALLVDPGNTLLWRRNLRRLEAEAIRDTILSVSGRLNLQMGGRGIFPTLAPEVLSTQSRPGLGWDKSSPQEQTRRSVYIFAKRTLGVPLLEAFDQATPDKAVAARTTTTIAPQALMLLNSDFMEEERALADRLIREVGTAPEANVERLFRLAVCRRPTADEARIARAYLERVTRQGPGPGAYRRALAMLCKVALNLNETVYVD